MIDSCVVQSRRTFTNAKERFLAGLPKGSVLFVTMNLREGTGKVEQVFVEVEKIDGLSIRGKVASHVLLLQGFSEGNPVVLSERELIDWVIVDADGKEEGNLVGKYLDLLKAGKTGAACSGS